MLEGKPGLGTLHKSLMQVTEKNWEDLSEQEQQQIELYLYHLEWQTPLGTTKEEAGALFSGNWWILHFQGTGHTEGENDE